MRVRSAAALLAISVMFCLQNAVQAQDQGSIPVSSVKPYGFQGNPLANPYNPYNPNNPYQNPYGNPYMNPYAYGGNPYGATPYGMYNGPIGPFVPYQWGGGMPVNLGGAAFSARIGNVNLNFWRAPSGYYYPWMGRPVGYAPIVYMDNSSGGQAQAKQPPIATQISDTLKFLDDSHKDNKLNDSYYQSLTRRAKDIQSKFRSYQIAQGGGDLDAGVEGEIRNDLSNLNKEMSEHIKP